MCSVRVHKVINQIISLFYYMGIWHRGDKPTGRELLLKCLYCIFYLLFVVSLIAGAITIENGDDKIFTVEISVAVGVLTVKIWILVWKQKQILDILNRICVFTIRGVSDLEAFNDKLRGFITFVIVFCVLVLLCTCEVAVMPFIGSKKTLVLEIGFPLDYKHSEIAFWLAHIFILIGTIISFAVIFYSIIIWYLLLTCSLRYDVLGRELKRVGRISTGKIEEITANQQYSTFIQDLEASIDTHVHIRELTNEVESFFSKIFFIQFGTSGLCICGSIYCLAFDVGDNSMQRLMNVILLYYFISDLFMITYFGNEIMLSSNRLSYCLFESEWLEQPQATKKCLIIFGEYVKQPHKLLIGKMFPLILETFTKILRSTYSMFNILTNFQK